MKTSVISGYATSEATTRYFQKIFRSHPEYLSENWYNCPISLKGIHVSRIAIAISHLNYQNRKNYDTLRDALISGINTIAIDQVSENPGSAILCHNVVHELMQAGRLERSEIVIVSGFGFTNTYDKNFKMYKLRPDLYYSLDPEFLDFQLKNLLNRLALNTLDVCMLYQPEVLLDYHRRLDQEHVFFKEFDQAINWLKYNINQSRIRFRGICSGSICLSQNNANGLTITNILNPTRTPDVVQFPANLIESSFRFDRNIPGGILSQQLQKNNIWSIAYRPFNAIQNAKLVRLIGQTHPSPDGGASTAAELNRYMDRLKQQENKVLEMFAHKQFQFDERLPAPSSYLDQFKDHFDETGSFNADLINIQKHLQKTFNYIRIHAQNEEHQYTMESLENLTNAFFVTWRQYIHAVYQKKVEHCQNQIAKTDPAYQNQPLGIQGLLYLLSQKTPQSTLINIKYPEQIRQIVKVFQLPLPAASSNLSTISALENALDSFVRDNSIG